MTTEQKGIASLIFGFWILLFLIYPSWLLPLDRGGRVTILAVFIFYFLSNAILLVRWIHRTLSSGGDLVKRASPSDSRWGFGWVFLAFLTVLLHLYPVGFPIRDDDDEAYHVASALTLKEKVEGLRSRMALEVASSSRGGKVAGVGGGGVVLALLLLGKRFGGVPWRLLGVIGIALGVSALILLWRLVLEEPYQQGLLHHPPLAKLLNVSVYLLFGISETKVRLLPLLFSVLTSLLIFKMVALYRSRQVAFLGALLILFLPNCFYYAGVAELGMGTLFFMTVAAYLGLLMLRREVTQTAFLWFVLIGGAGFFYHRTAVIILGILLVFFLWMRLRGDCDPKTFRRWLGAAYFASVPILLWFLVAYFLVYPYTFLPENFIRPRILSRYLFQMPSQIGYPLFLLFLLGLGGSLLRKKDPLVALCLVWFFLGYLFYSGEVTARRLSWGIPRYVLTLYGPVAILMADLLGRFVERVGVFGGRLTIGILLVSLLLVSTVIPMWPVETRYTTFLQRRQSTYASYEEAIPFMMKTLPQGSRIFDTRGSNYFKFYVGKYRPSLVWNKEESEAIQYEPRNSQQELLLYQKCRRESFDYVFCESGGLSKNRFALLRVFENKETKRCLWKVL